MSKFIAAIRVMIEAKNQAEAEEFIQDNINLKVTLEPPCIDDYWVSSVEYYEVHRD